MRRFRRLCGALLEDDSPPARDLALALLLAWSGILPGRLTRDERRVVARRLRRLVRKPLFTATVQAPLSGALSEPEWVGALGRVAYEAHEDFVVDLLSDFAHEGFGGIDFDASGWGGADASPGADGGGSDGGSGQ